MDDNRVRRIMEQTSCSEAKSRGTLTNNLCSDHRDKQSGKPCLACEIERQAQEIAELRAQLADAKFAPMGDNHHNAAACPYCRPKLTADDERHAALRWAKALHTALRKAMIDSRLCYQCHTEQEFNAPERHAPGCFAAPVETK